MANKSVDKVAVASKHPGVFMQTSELEAESGDVIPKSPKNEIVDKDVDEEEKTESSAPTTPKEVKTDEDDDDEMNVEWRKSPLPESERIDETFEDSVVEDADQKNENDLTCDESVEDMDDLVISDDDIVEEQDQETMKKADEESNENVDTTAAVDSNSDNDVKKDELSCEVEVVSHEKKSDEEESGVVTRRSQRRKTPRNIATDNDDDNTAAHVANLNEMESESSETESKDHVLKNESEAGGADDLIDENCDEESVTSEMDSLTSGSTLTTRSALRRGAKRSVGGKKTGNKGSGKSGQMFGKNKSKSGAGNANQSKGKSRRIIFKKSSTKAPNSVARAVTSDRVFHKGQYFTKGDVVSVTDVDGGTFYAQLRGFLTDQYCEKSGVITWLLPTTHSPDPDEMFDPATYVVGPEEEFPRKLDYFTFVMHAPDDYFYYKNAPYPTDVVCTDQEYVLTRLGPKVRLVNSSGKTFFNDVVL